jgi:hypothetical protein
LRGYCQESVFAQRKHDLVHRLEPVDALMAI